MEPALERHDDPRPEIDDRFTYYEADLSEIDGENCESGLWHDFGAGNRQKLKPRYE